MWSKEWIGVAGSLLWFSMVGCSSRTVPDAGSAGPAVALINERRITVAEVEAALRSQPDFMRARFDSPERKLEYVDGLVRNELLLQEARRRGLESKPEVREAFERLLIQQVISEETKASEATEADARAFYEAHVAEFTRPERLQLAIVQFGATAAKPAATRGEVEKEVTRLRGLKGDQQKAAFVALVAARSSHEASRSVEGDLGLRTKEELTQALGSAAADQAFVLSTPGEVSGAADSTNGLIIFRLVARVPSEVRPFEAEKQRILARLTAERRTRALEDLVKRLRASAKVSVDEEQVKKLDVGAPAGALVP